MPSVTDTIHEVLTQTVVQRADDNQNVAERNKGVIGLIPYSIFLSSSRMSKPSRAWDMAAWRIQNKHNGMAQARKHLGCCSQKTVHFSDGACRRNARLVPFPNMVPVLRVGRLLLPRTVGFFLTMSSFGENTVLELGRLAVRNRSALHTKNGRMF